MLKSWQNLTESSDYSSAVYMSGLEASVCRWPEMYALIAFDIPISLSRRLLRAMQEVNELQ